MNLNSHIQVTHRYLNRDIHLTLTPNRDIHLILAPNRDIHLPPGSIHHRVILLQDIPQLFRDIHLLPLDIHLPLDTLLLFLDIHLPIQYHLPDIRAELIQLRTSNRINSDNSNINNINRITRINRINSNHHINNSSDYLQWKESVQF